MLRFTFSRCFLPRPRCPVRPVRHAQSHTALLAFRRLYSSPVDPQNGSNVGTSQTVNLAQPVIELPPPHRQGSAEASPSPNTAFTPPSHISHDTSNVEEAPRPPDNSQPPADKPTPLANVIDVDEVKERLRSWTERAAGVVRDRVDRYTIAAATAFAQLGRELNKVTGYGEIESLKRQVTEQERRIKAAREAAREAKVAFERAVQQRARSQREVNDLLQRKSSWTDADVGRFTALVRQDHLYEQEETLAKAKAIETEEEVEREFTELMRVILNRYHEEQVWSDKIRSASTYGSLTVLGLNLAVFVLAIIVVEPWKRRRLAQTFEKKVEEMSAQTLGTVESKYEELSKQLRRQDEVLCQLVEAIHYSLQPAAVASASAEDVLLQRREPSASVFSTFPRFERSRISPEQLWAMAASAAFAGVLGWLIGSWHE